MMYIVVHPDVHLNIDNNTNIDSLITIEYFCA